MSPLRAASLDGLPGLRHGFFTREGGVSSGLFASLNLGLRSGDEPANVAANRERIARAMGYPPARLVAPRQVHGTACAILREPWPAQAPPDADALATNEPGLLLGITTADCAPVLLAAPAAGVIGAAHAGWKGALLGVLESALEAMQALGADRDGIVAAIGPCIAASSYEVGPEFEARFLAEDPTSALCFAPLEGSDRRLFDLKAYVAARLRRAGVGQVEILPFDTCAEEERFFSFRRATRRQEARFGVQLSAIGLA